MVRLILTAKIQKNLVIKEAYHKKEQYPTDVCCSFAFAVNSMSVTFEAH